VKIFIFMLVYGSYTSERMYVCMFKTLIVYVCLYVCMYVCMYVYMYV
jgi:hypothetical protein